MHVSTATEERPPVPPESDRERFAARDDSSGEVGSSSSRAGFRQPGSAFAAALGTPLMPLLAVAIITIGDRLTDRALGANLGVSLLMVFPIYWAARVAGTRSGILVAATGGLLWFLSELTTLATLHLPSFPYGMAGIHVALFAAAIALAMEHRRLLEERSLATTDFLTGVANRRGFYETLTREIERSRRYRTPMTLLYLDCDEFKTVNDTMGHPVGNRLLERIASILKVNTRAVDVVGRLGGDEFAVLLVETPAERGAKVVARLQQEMRSLVGPEAPAVTFSIGAITFDSPPADPTEAIRIADALMYQAKRTGKDRVVQAIAD